MMKPILIAGLLAASFAGSALAHSKAENTTPADASTVAAVEAIELRFDEPMRVTAIALTGADGEIEIERETGLDPVTEFRALPAVALAEGDYVVDCRGLPSDGHPMQGSFGFTVAAD